MKAEKWRLLQKLVSRSLLSLLQFQTFESLWRSYITNMAEGVMCTCPTLNFWTVFKCMISALHFPIVWMHFARLRPQNKKCFVVHIIVMEHTVCISNTTVCYKGRRQASVRTPWMLWFSLPHNTWDVNWIKQPLQSMKWQLGEMKPHATFYLSFGITGLYNFMNCQLHFGKCLKYQPNLIGHPSLLTWLITRNTIDARPLFKKDALRANQFIFIAYPLMTKYQKVGASDISWPSERGVKRLEA